MSGGARGPHDVHWISVCETGCVPGDEAAPGQSSPLQSWRARNQCAVPPTTSIATCEDGPACRQKLAPPTALGRSWRSIEHHPQQREVMRRVQAHPVGHGTESCDVAEAEMGQEDSTEECVQAGQGMNSARERRGAVAERPSQEPAPPRTLWAWDQRQPGTAAVVMERAREGWGIGIALGKDAMGAPRNEMGGQRIAGNQDPER